MTAILRSVVTYLTSLSLTVALILLSIVLVLAATLDQVNLGLLAVQEKYFRTFFVFVHPFGSETLVPIFPGGYLLGGLLLANLVAVHLCRFRFAWKHAGIILTHAGLVVLLIGELLTGLWQRESQMDIREGGTSRYSEDFNLNELALIDTTDAGFDHIVSVPEALVADGGTIRHGSLPFQMRVVRYLPNAKLQMRGHDSDLALPSATVGAGTSIAVAPEHVTRKPNERNTPAAFVEVLGADGSLGTWLVSPALATPQQVTYRGRTWQLSLRAKRYYNPYGITLLKVTHDVYPGSGIPKNFASRIRIRSDDGRDDREVVVYMNNPLRYRGLTYYQYQMNKAEGLTVFQVVRNPSWALPYAACLMMGAGLAVQFCIHLLRFVQLRRSTVITAPAT